MRDFLAMKGFARHSQENRGLYRVIWEVSFQEDFFYSLVRRFGEAMVPFAISLDGQPVYPEQFSESEWQELKSKYKVGELILPCCSSPAIPKTSINGVQFFSHLVDECVTSPESQWHIGTKDKLVRQLVLHGVTAHLEYSTRGSSGLIKSDVFFEWHGRRIAIEVQHSYQTLTEYLRRQDRYRAEGMENYWLLYKPRYLTLIKSIGRLRMRRDFGDQFPPGGFWAVIPELPMALYDPEFEGGSVLGGAPLKTSLPTWLSAILGGSFRYVDGAWRIA